MGFQANINENEEIGEKTDYCRNMINLKITVIFFFSLILPKKFAKTLTIF